MFRFANPQYLYLLLLLPLLIAMFFYVRARYKARLKRFGNIDTVRTLMPEVAPAKVTTKYFMTVTAILFLCIALARPQIGSKLKEMKKRGVEIILAVDVSNSMLAEDYSPSRLERTRYAIRRLVERLENDRVGVIVFAGDAFVQLPVTSDFTSAGTFISHLSPNMVSKQGTSIGSALELAGRSFSDQSENSRVVIVISDGETHDKTALEEAKKLKEKGIQVNAIGIGTPEGAPISIGGRMMQDRDGNLVVSKLNEELMKNIAISTGGTYVRATDQSLGLEQIMRRIREVNQKEFSSVVFDEYNDQFQYVIALALIALLLEYLMLERKNRFIAGLTLFNKDKDEKEA